MKRLALFLLLVALLHELPAQTTPPYSDEQVLKAISKRTPEEVKSVDYFRVAPPERAWTAFGYLSMWAPHYKNTELLKKAGQAIAENPGVEKYVTEGMAKLPHVFYNDGDRVRFLAPLCYVPAPWSLRMLGKYLMDKTPMIYPEVPPDYGASTNQDLAILGLQRMGFADAPPENRISGLTPAVEKGWHNWWIANKDRVEERIHEINPGYRPPVSATPAR